MVDEGLLFVFNFIAIYSNYVMRISNIRQGNPSDKLAEPNEKGEWVCGECQIEELNKHKMRVFGLQHPNVKAFIQKEDNDCRRWNNYVKRVNQTMGSDLKYKKNRYTSRTPF